MPDHIHAIITGTSDTADAHAAMSKFKQYSGYALARSGGGIRWQKDFYDYIHRKERDLFTHMEYILKNPIRKGLCDSWQDYPYKGSTVYDLDRWPTG